MADFARRRCGSNPSPAAASPPISRADPAAPGGARGFAIGKFRVHHRRPMHSMRSFLRSLSGIVAALGLAGCFQIEQVINVNPDGSGTAMYSIKMGKDGLEAMKALNSASPNNDPVEQMMKPEEIQRMAAKLGEGAKLEKVEPFKEGEYSGKRATFSFPDISKVKADMNLGPDGGEDSQPIWFEFVKGTPAKLIAHAPVKKKKEPKPDN